MAHETFHICLMKEIQQSDDLVLGSIQNIEA